MFFIVLQNNQFAKSMSALISTHAKSDLKSQRFANNQNCFDFIRYYLALMVILTHYDALTGTDNFNLWIGGSEAVSGFFMISGFFVYNSYMAQPDISHFVVKRLLRICPPYFFIVLLCAAAGVIISSENASDYFTSAHLFRYLAANLTFMNFIEPSLPGVFEGQVFQAVNGALWTMKIEILLYATVPITYVLFKRYNKMLILICLFAFSYIYSAAFGYLYEQSGKSIYLILERQVGGQLVYFYAGVAVLFFFKEIESHIRWLFPIATVAFIFRYDSTFLLYLKPFSMAVMLCGIAFHASFLNFAGRFRNLSYGIYLFHYPVIQTAIHFDLTRYGMPVALTIIIICTVLLAYLSLIFIEEPVWKWYKTHYK